MKKVFKIDIVYNCFGKFGFKIFKVVLGVMFFGSKEWCDWVLEEKEVLFLFEYVWKVGINIWDIVSFIYKINCFLKN